MFCVIYSLTYINIQHMNHNNGDVLHVSIQNTFMAPSMHCCNFFYVNIVEVCMMSAGARFRKEVKYVNPEMRETLGFPFQNGRFVKPGKAG